MKYIAIPERIYQIAESILFRWGLAMVTLAVYWLAALPKPDIGADSLSLYDMARYLFTDFGRVAIVRQHWLDVTDYAASFPLVFPLLIAIIDKVTGWGVYSGYWLNLVIVALTWPALRFLCGAWGELDRRQQNLLGFALWASLVLNLHYISDATAARTVPLAILWLVLLAGIWARPVLMAQLKFQLLAGVLAALAAQTRFDLTLYCFFGVFAQMALTPEPTIQRKLRAGLLYCVGVAPIIAPWVVHSWLHFGKIYATDNGAIALSAIKVHVAEYWPVPPPNVFAAPFLFLWKLCQTAPMVALRAIQILAKPLNLILVLSFLWAWRTRRLPELPQTGRPLKILALLSCSVFIGMVLTGYDGRRYYMVPLLFCILLPILLRFCLKWSQQLHIAVIAALLVAAIVPQFLFILQSDMPRFRPNPALTTSERFGALAECVGKDARVFYVGGKAYEFGALTGIFTVYAPRNWPSLSDSEQAGLLRRHKITHFVGQDGDGFEKTAPSPGFAERHSDSMRPQQGCWNGSDLAKYHIPVYQLESFR